MKRRTLYIVCLFVLIATGCKHNSYKADRAFYYWHSVFNLAGKDVGYLQDAGVTKLYLHFFDVAWDDTYNKVLPVAEMKFETKPMDRYQYIPVVYIANKAFEETPADSINRLAVHVLNEINHIASDNDISYKELQFDCDWTEGTRDKYFKFLACFHDSLKQVHKILSATIRLHQIKYADKTGVPPVDRGVLMFYNIGKVNILPGYNSIYNSKDADLYTDYIKSYQLPLDVALPVFSWAVEMSNGKVTGIMEKVGIADFTDTALFRSKGNNIFVTRAPFFMRGKYFMKNDSVKVEEVTPEICNDAATNAHDNLKDEKRTVILFDYDSLYLKHYDKKDIEKIFSVYSN